HADNVALVPAQGPQLPAGGGVPEPEGLVPAASDEARAVGAEGHGVDHLGMRPDGPESPAGGGVPDPRGLVVAGRGDPASVGAEREVEDEVAVPAETGRELAGRRVPEGDSSRGTVAERRGEAAAIRAEPHIG